MLERASVEHGLRSSCLLMLRPEELVQVSKWAVSSKLVAVPLGLVRMSNTYTSGPVSSGEPGLRVAVCRPELARRWHAAFDGSDDETIGWLLGFPPCCREFFSNTWKKGSRDTTPQMKGAPGLGKPISNILLRWLGVRFVGHLPCSWNCELTERVALENAGLARKLGLSEQVDAALSLLGMEMEYTTLHGVCEVTTSQFKFCASSDYHPKKVEVKKTGLLFIDAGSEPEVIVPLSLLKLDSKLNGFSSDTGQSRAHATVLEVARHVVESGPLLDLGCGDGTLVSAAAGMSAIPIWGCDISGEAVRKCHAKFPGARDRFQQRDIWKFFDQEGLPEFEVTFLMPGRLTEWPIELAHHFRRKLLTKTKSLVVYMYGDWSKKYELRSMCEMLRLGTVEHLNRGADDTQAGVIRLGGHRD